MQFVAAAADDDDEEEGIRQERAEARGHKQVVNSLKGEYLPVLQLREPSQTDRDSLR